MGGTNPQKDKTCTQSVRDFVQIDKNLKKTDFRKFVKVDKILENIIPCVRAEAPKAYFGVLLSISRRKEL